MDISLEAEAETGLEGLRVWAERREAQASNKGS